MSRVSPVRLAFNEFLPDKDFDEELNPVIFLHGLTIYKEFVEDLAKLVANATKRKVYAVDARNHGDSEWSENFNFDINADDILHFIDDKGIKKAIIVGECMGGFTAIKAALKSPDKIEKIAVEYAGMDILTDDILEFMLIGIETYQKAIEALPPKLDESEAKQFIVKYVNEEYKKRSKPAQETYRKMVGEKGQKFTPDVMKLRRKDDGTFTFCANLRVIEKMIKTKNSIMSPPEGVYLGPACFIYGDKAIFDVENQKNEALKHFPNATLVSVEGTSHTVRRDKPEKFIDNLLKFI